MAALVVPSVTYDAEPAVLDLDRLAADRVGLELLERARAAAVAVLRLRVQLQRTGQVDVEDELLARQRPGVGPLLQVGAVAPVLGEDLGLRLGVDADDARQRKQPKGGVEVDGVDRHRLEEDAVRGLTASAFFFGFFS